MVTSSKGRISSDALFHNSPGMLLSSFLARPHDEPDERRQLLRLQRVIYTYGLSPLHSIVAGRVICVTSGGVGRVRKGGSAEKFRSYGD